MTKENQIRIHRIYGILLSASIVVAGICLIAGCLSIYNSGDQPYSREAVAATFSHIAIPVYLCLALTILGFVLDVLLPAVPVKPYRKTPYSAMLNQLRLRKDWFQCPDDVKQQIEQLQQQRRTYVTVRTAVIVLASVLFLTYALNFNNFDSSNINGSMIGAMRVLIPCLAVALTCSTVVAVLLERSIIKETELIKTLPSKSGAVKNAETAEANFAEATVADSSKRITYVRYAILTVGVFLAVYGFATGGIADVLAKAVNICTECIGLG